MRRSFAGTGPVAGAILLTLAPAASLAQVEQSPAIPMCPGDPRCPAGRGFSFKRSTTAPSTAPKAAARSAAGPMARPAGRSGDVNLTFAAGKSELSVPGRSQLDAVAKALNTLPGRRFRIEGHSAEPGTAADNLRLSKARAEAVRDHLVSQGVSPERLEVVGYANTRPKPGLRADAPENRRVEIVKID